MNRAHFFVEKLARHDLDERSLKRLVNSRCATCGHPWQMHFDQEHAASRSCQSSMNGQPNCNCMGYAPPDLELRDALATLDSPLILEAKKALGLIPSEPAEDEPPPTPPPPALRSEDLAAHSIMQAARFGADLLHRPPPIAPPPPLPTRKRPRRGGQSTRRMAP